MRKLLVVFVIMFCCIAAGVIIDQSVFAESEKKRSAKENSNKSDSITVKMSEEKWKEKLTPEQYRILRKAGTERPFGEVYSKFKKQGVELMFVPVVIPSCLARMRNLILNAVGHLFMTLQMPKM